jgi:hypothetical protein
LPLLLLLLQPIALLCQTRLKRERERGKRDREGKRERERERWRDSLGRNGRVGRACGRATVASQMRALGV